MSALGDALRAMQKVSPRRSRYNGSNYLRGFREGYAEAMGVAAVVADAWPIDAHQPSDQAIGGAE